MEQIRIDTERAQAADRVGEAAADGVGWGRIDRAGIGGRQATGSTDTSPSLREAPSASLLPQPALLHALHEASSAPLLP